MRESAFSPANRARSPPEALPYKVNIKAIYRLSILINEAHGPKSSDIIHITGQKDDTMIHLLCTPAYIEAPRNKEKAT